MKSLQTFYQDTDTKDNVHTYLVEYLEKEAVRRVFEREDVSAVADAKEIINQAFENMETLFSPKVVGKEIINESR